MESRVERTIGRHAHLRNRRRVDVAGLDRPTPREGLFSVRNVLSESYIIWERVGASPDAACFFQKFDLTPTMGVKSTP